MIERTGLKVFIIVIASLFISVGCGGGKAKVEISSGDDAKRDSKPFNAPNIGGGGGGGLSSALSESDEQLVVPGSQYGEAPPVKQAKKKKKKKKKGKKGKKGGAALAIPYTEGIADQMEGLMWGMTARKVISIFEFRVKDTYSEELSAAAGDALAEDAIRTKMIRELSRMTRSYVEFKGQRTGFESHMISDEFTHNNDESMLVWDAGKYVEYLFFIDGRFWKRLRAFRKDSFQSDISFMDFLGSLENRFGSEGQESFDAKGDLDKVRWRDEETYADAVDRSAFFGAYGLRFSAAITVTYLDKLRSNVGRETGAVADDISSMVDSVTSGGEELTDHQSSVIDGYTGQAQTGPGAAKVDTTHSVTGKYKKKKGTEKAEKEKEEPTSKENKGSKDDIDDLF